MKEQNGKRSALWTELTRAFCSRGMAASLGVGALFVLAHALFDLLPASSWNASQTFSGFQYPYTVSDKWIGLHITSASASILYFVFPLLAALPFLSSLYSDKTSGYAQQVVSRCGRGRYLFAKHAAVFLSAFAAVLLPLLADLAVTACLFPALPPEPASGLASLGSRSAWAALYFAHPILYILVYALFDSAWIALFVSAFLPLSRYMSFYVEALLLPEFIYMFLYFLGTWANASFAIPYFWLFPLQPFAESFPGVFLAETAGLLLASAALYFVEVKTHDLSV